LFIPGLVDVAPGLEVELLPEPDGPDTEPLAEPDGVDTEPLAEVEGLLDCASARLTNPAVAAASRRMVMRFMLHLPGAL
jgi:hypothetical protein